MIKCLLVLAAVVAAVIPTPRSWIELAYSRGFYTAFERRLTPLTNEAPFALLDPLALVVISALLIRWIRHVTGAGSGHRLRAALFVAWDALAVSAVLYLLFLGFWGLNYRRVPLRERMVFDADRVNVDALLALGGDAVDRLNALHAGAHRAGWSGFPAEGAPARAYLDQLGPAFEQVQRDLAPGSSWFETAVPGVPKRSILDWYFARAGIDGMTNPYLLEVLVNHDLLPFERPFVVAHEWGHLAGYADESESSFVGWLTCVRGDQPAQYSAWLFLYPHVVTHLNVNLRRQLAARLAEGPRRDLDGISARLRSVIPVVRSGAERVYDRFLKANRVREGIESYDLVITLVLGSRFEPGWKPVMR